MDTLEQALLNDYQRHFPLVAKPFEKLATELSATAIDVTEKDVIETLGELLTRGKISRVGPVFKPRMLGASTLAAMSVPAEKLAKVAELVNGFSEVNHNYEREHRFNLWFVAVAASQLKLDQVLAQIEQLCGYEVMSLPLVKEYHIDLGFKMNAPRCKKALAQEILNHQQQSESSTSLQVEKEPIDLAKEEGLIAAIQGGLPLVERPFLALAKQLAISEQQVIKRISRLQDAAVIRRFGVVVRHHELGYRANAMVVWNIADEKIDALGKQLSTESEVTLCYQRPRKGERWPYNLFSMIHGKDRAQVSVYIDELVAKLGLNNVPFEVLFSLQRFKQCGAKYVIDKSLVS